MLAPNVVSLPALISWLRTKNPEEEYRFTDTRKCVFAQYLEHHGHLYGQPVRNDPFDELHTRYIHIARPKNSGPDYSSTFGQALERALQMQENPDVY